MKIIFCILLAACTANSQGLRMSSRVVGKMAVEFHPERQWMEAGTGQHLMVRYRLKNFGLSPQVIEINLQEARNLLVQKNLPLVLTLEPKEMRFIDLPIIVQEGASHLRLEGKASQDI